MTLPCTDITKCNYVHGFRISKNITIVTNNIVIPLLPLPLLEGSPLIIEHYGGMKSTMDYVHCTFMHVPYVYSYVYISMYSL